MQEDERIQIFLTDQLVGRPNIKTLSREIMLAVQDFYYKPEAADGFRAKNFTDWHRNGWDSGGFQVLMKKIPPEKANPFKTIEIYKRIGVKEQDFPIQLDLPPAYDLSDKEKISFIERSALYYHIMKAEIPFVIGVVHGWKYEQLCYSLELIEDPDKLCSATNIPLSARNETGPFPMGAGAFLQSGRYVLDEAGNLKKNRVVGCGSFKAANTEYILDHVTSDKSHVLGAGTFAPTALDWSMGNLNPHSSITDRLASAVPNDVDFGEIPVIDRVNSRGKRRDVIGVGSFTSPSTIAVDEVISSKPRTKALGVGAFLQSGTWACDYMANTPNRKENKRRTPRKKRRKPIRPRLDVIIDRLALVLNMLRDRKLFMLGGASPHMQHMIFAGGATFSDTSAWRIKGYFGEIYIPERGSRAIGYKATSKRPDVEDLKILGECLRDPTHPFHGMPLKRFLTIGHFNVEEWRKTWKQNKWEVKPFPLRALHNAWVLKTREEVIANEFETDPDRYYRYLKHRFHNNYQLLHRLDNLWRRLKRPYVQTKLSIFLKGQTPTSLLGAFRQRSLFLQPKPVIFVYFPRGM